MWVWRQGGELGSSFHNQSRVDNIMRLGRNCPDLDDLDEWVVPFGRGSFWGEISVRCIGYPRRSTKRQQLIGLDLRTEA